MRTRSFLNLGPGGFHRIAYSEWGTVDAARTVVCVHGLTRNRHDFDDLAAHLAGRGLRVVCPDMPGRGDSDWLLSADQYEVPHYLNAMAALIARLDVEAVDWIGTSMGGIIGMVLAAQPNSPIRRLVLNDLGAFIPQAALERLRGYVGLGTAFPDLAAVEAHLRETLAGFDPLPPEKWRRLAETSSERMADGSFRLRYDPQIGEAVRTAPLQDAVLWPVWEAVRCPVLLLRGGKSDLLLAETAAEMTTRGPGCRLVTFAESGHAPALMDQAQIDVVADWL